MTMYKLFKVINGENLFSKLSNRKKKIEHPRINNFFIQNKMDYISGSGTEIVESYFSKPGTPVTAEIKIEIIISQYQLIYCIVGLSGNGLLIKHSYERYIKDDLLDYLKQHFKREYDLDVDFKLFEFENIHFSKQYWGDDVKSQKAYNYSEHMHINLSSSHFYDLLERLPEEIGGYFSDGKIKYMKGISSDLKFEKEGIKQVGRFKFERSGRFHCDSDMDSFNNFIMKLIDKNFFGR